MTNPPIDPDSAYKLTGTCRGCQRVTWLCRRDRRCERYATTARAGYTAQRRGFYPTEEAKP